MPTLPLMPSSSDQMGTPMPGPMAGGPPPFGPSGQQPGGDQSARFMGGNLAGGVDPIQMGMGQFDRVAQDVADTARMFPGTEQLASQVMEILDQWRQQVLVMMTPQPSSMPGADQMM